jgi:predicted RecB family nuclease
MKEAEDHKEELKNNFHEKMRTNKYFAMDRSKMENIQFVGFAAMDINDGITWKFRIAKLASAFTAEALATAETLEIIEKVDSEQNFVIFSDSESVLQGISNTLHITQVFKDKIRG